MLELDLVLTFRFRLRRARLIITLQEIAATELDELITRSGSHRVRKVNDLEYRIDPDLAKGMRVPVTIYVKNGDR